MKTTNYHSDKPNWGVNFTIRNAWEAKCHVAMYSKTWRKETWTKWFAFLKTIGVYYDKEKREYKDMV